MLEDCKKNTEQYRNIASEACELTGQVIKGSTAELPDAESETGLQVNQLLKSLQYEYSIARYCVISMAS